MKTFAASTNKLGAYFRLMRFDRPIGILLLLWPTLWALWLASHGFPDKRILLIFIIGVVVMRAAGCIINDYADRNFDGKVLRTRGRPLVNGEVSVVGALLLFSLLCLVALLLVIQLNLLAIIYSIPALFLTLFYPFAKRFIAVPQVVLGVTFAWSIPMAYAATQDSVPHIAWLLLLATFFWILAYDTEYALSDREDDIKIGIKSSAVFFGRFAQVWIGISQLCMLSVLFLMGLLQKFSPIFYLSLLIALAFMIFQQVLIAGVQRERCLQAFLNNNWVGATIFLAFLLALRLL